MKRSISTVHLLLLVGFLLLPSAALPQDQVLLIVRETSENMSLMITEEAKPLIKGLTDAGFRVVVATESGEDIVAGSVILKVDAKLSDLGDREFRAVVVPCMAAGGTARETPAVAIPILKKSMERGIPLAAQQSGVRLLAVAGALDGKRYACGENLYGMAKGATYQGTGVVRDGSLMTSGTCPYQARSTGRPDGTSELLKALLSALQ